MCGEIVAFVAVMKTKDHYIMDTGKSYLYHHRGPKGNEIRHWAILNGYVSTSNSAADTVIVTNTENS